MFRICLQNDISASGLELFPPDRYTLSTELSRADAILVRSAKLHDIELPDTLMAIARAGVGVNNIPIDACTQRGIAVFNTPGANANGVKELVLAAMLLSSRRLYSGVTWAQSLRDSGADVPRAVERGKAQFAGPELKGKRLGVIGLGAVGTMVANDALALGMEVIGYDKYISVDAAWGLSRHVVKASSLEHLLSISDYVTLHVPLTSSTEGMLADREFKLMRSGVRVINLARGELVDTESLMRAIDGGVVACYVTDFPTAELLGHDQIIPIPHLGASTPEAEENCAAMAVRRLRDYLERGVVSHSVNFPDCDLATIQGVRFVVAHRNIPNMIGQITTALARDQLNITELLNAHRGDLGYTIIDVEGQPGADALRSIRAIDGVRVARVVGGPEPGTRWPGDTNGGIS
jgi:D-3-phosphoglycerate dehydrogenase / 2-oxoglutarate reductase